MLLNGNWANSPGSARKLWTAGMPEGVSSESTAEWESRWLSPNLTASRVMLQIPQDHDRSLWYRLISPRSLRSPQSVWELLHHTGVCANQGLALKPARKCSLWLRFTLEFLQQREIKQREVLARNVKHGVQRIILPAVAGRFKGGSDVESKYTAVPWQRLYEDTNGCPPTCHLSIHPCINLTSGLSSIYFPVYHPSTWNCVLFSNP